MGNCGFKGFRDAENTIKVVTSNGGMMELYPPITAEQITAEFPDQAIFRSRNGPFFSRPLFNNEELRAGELYYLLPLGDGDGEKDGGDHGDGAGASSYPSSAVVSPYRLSFDQTRSFQKRVVNPSSEPEVFPRYSSAGVWKVKLVISPEQLAEILSQEARTEELIESVRTVVKCGSATSE